MLVYGFSNPHSLMLNVVFTYLSRLNLQLFLFSHVDLKSDTILGSMFSKHFFKNGNEFGSPEYIYDILPKGMIP